MNLHLADKLKELRSKKNISQEKLAQYLNVSFQAVSKWENGNSYPDITLLPDIAGFFGITVDELLCVEKPDERALFPEYKQKAGELFRDGKRAEALALWQEAYKRMPNNIDVKEMLMSAYFDTDKEKYYREFVELATDIYNSDAEGRAWNMYYKGQAISQLAQCYAERGDTETAQKWALKSVSIFHSSEIIRAWIDKGDDLLCDTAFCTYWFLEELFGMAIRIGEDDNIKPGNAYKQKCFEIVAEIFETVYREDDMGSEQFRHLYELYRKTAEYEAKGGKKEETVRRCLERAMQCCEKSAAVQKHTLTHPMLYGWEIADAPHDNTVNRRAMKKALEQDIYDDFRSFEWFQNLERKCAAF